MHWSSFCAIPFTIHCVSLAFVNANVVWFLLLLFFFYLFVCWCCCRCCLLVGLVVSHELENGKSLICNMELYYMQRPKCVFNQQLPTHIKLLCGYTIFFLVEVLLFLLFVVNEMKFQMGFFVCCFHCAKRDSNLK